MFEICGPQGAMEHVTAPKPTPAGKQGLKTQDTWHRQSPPQLGGEVWRHVAAPEPTPVGKGGPETQDMWQCRSPPQPKDEVQSHRTRGSVGVHLSREMRSGAIGHVAAPEPTSTRRLGPEA
jgi:hypothetical protein